MVAGDGNIRRLGDIDATNLGYLTLSFKVEGRELTQQEKKMMEIKGRRKERRRRK